MIEPFFTTTTETKASDHAVFTIEPLPQGFGHTLGNSLRRVLLTFLSGTAVSFVRIKGVRHQFSTVAGMKEDIVDFILNLKKIHFHLEGEKEIKINFTKNGPGEVTAADIKLPAQVTIANPEEHLATLVNRDAKLDVAIWLEQGTGFTTAEDRKTTEIGMIPVDSLFSPIRRVNFTVEETRVGRETNYDRLVLDMWTNGSLDPQQALTEAAQILVSFTNHIYNPKTTPVKQKNSSERVSHAVMKTSVEELELSVRVINALKKGGFTTLADFQGKSSSDLENVRNLGAKSIDLIAQQLEERGIEFSS